MLRAVDQRKEMAKMMMWKALMGKLPLFFGLLAFQMGAEPGVLDVVINRKIWSTCSSVALLRSRGGA